MLCRIAGFLCVVFLAAPAPASAAGGSLDRLDRPTRDVTGRSFAQQQRLDQSTSFALPALPGVTGDQAKTTLQRQDPNLFARPRGLPPPPAPTNLQAAAGDNQITLHWSRGGSDKDIPERYLVWRSENNGQSFALLTHAASDIILPQPQAETQFHDTNVVNGTDYLYTVVAVRRVGDADIDSSPSDAVRATPFRAYDLSLTPSALETEGSFAASVGLRYFNSTPAGNKYSIGVGYTHLRNEADGSSLDQTSVSGSYLLNTSGPVALTPAIRYSQTQGGSRSASYSVTARAKIGNLELDPSAAYIVKHSGLGTSSGFAPVMEADYTLTRAVDVDVEYDFKTDITGDDSWAVTGSVAVDPATSVQLGVGKGDTVNIAVTFLFK